ncbi:MAG: imidazole glycerol phosphate synthase subunit HisH [Anaerolineales bacterium]
MSIALIDYGIGNLRSVRKAFEAVGAKICQTDQKDEILSADKIVLPGVGAFEDGMIGLEKRGLIPVLKQAHKKGTPILGICLGMQLLFEYGYEMGTHKGLGFIPGHVKQFPKNELKIPHTGWNQLKLKKNSTLLTDIPDQAYVYFNHGFFCLPDEPQDTITTTDYGLTFCSAVQRKHLFGVQFHPEKSQGIGLTILRNFWRYANE